MPPMIEVSQLGKRYRIGSHVRRESTLRELLASPFRKRAAAARTQPERVFWALRNLSFNVAPGEIVGIIGANGAGKSTLLKILSRITDPTEGRAVLHGRMASLLEVGTGFHPELTGRENIFLNGAVLGMRNAEIRERFDEIVAFAEIEKFLDTPVKHYSSGMSVRLGFAVAAHLQPEILVVDEVLAVGDMAFQKKCLGKMSEVSRTGRTILFVSHNMAAVENLCSRGIVLKSGELLFDGEVKTAIAQYLTLSHSIAGGDSHIVDLAEAPTRKPHNQPILQRVELFTNHGEPAPRALQTGAELRIRLTLRFPSHSEVPLFQVGIGFNTIFGQRVLTLHTSFDPELAYDPVSGQVTLECLVPSLTLMPGEYLIFLYVDIGHERKDAINDAWMLSVLESDYYGTGRAPFSGVFVLPHRWTMNAGSEPEAESHTNATGILIDHAK